MIVNDRVDVALAVGADGVHLGQDDLPAGDARRLIGARRMLGLSASTVDEAVRADAAGADYIGFGPVFATGSKERRPAARPGWTRSAEAVAAVSDADRGHRRHRRRVPRAP